MITLSELRQAIRASWGADTCFDAAEWSQQNPARGQCVPTALVVQHFLGGTLQKYDTVYQGKPENHYANTLPDGQLVDLTGHQYPADQKLVPSEVNLHGYADVLDKMRHEPQTMAHYRLLLARTKEYLAER